MTQGLIVFVCVMWAATVAWAYRLGVDTERKRVLVLVTTGLRDNIRQMKQMVYLVDSGAKKFFKVDEPSGRGDLVM